MNDNNQEAESTFHFDWEDNDNSDNETEPLSLDELREVMAEIRY